MAPASPKVFLTAEWRDLILLNFAVSDELLEPYLTKGLELDRWEGKAFVSLVAFDFMKTKVFGRSWPGHTNFSEINLRFYVRKGDLRGVAFIREIVPQRFTALVARVIYNEPYVAAPIDSILSKSTDGALTRAYKLTWGDKTYEVRAKGSLTSSIPPPTSREHFFKEHEHGFGRGRHGALTHYRVEHPVWSVYPLQRASTNFDFGEIYGEEWRVLNGRDPDSAVFAAGSEVKVLGLSE